MIDYSVCHPYELEVQALAVVESHEDVEAKGDPGNNDYQARGLLQQHPVFLVQYYRMGSAYPPKQGDSYLTMWLKAAAQFFHETVLSLTLTGAVQAYNLGIGAYKNGARNPVYLGRFNAALGQLRANQHSLRAP